MYKNTPSWDHCQFRARHLALAVISEVIFIVKNISLGQTVGYGHFGLDAGQFGGL